MLLTARWVLPISGKPIGDGAVLVEGEKISAVGEQKKMRRSHPQEEILNFGNAIILPGFVNTHTHLEYSILRGVCDDLPFVLWIIQLIKKSQRLNQNDWLVSAKLGTLEAIHSGITCMGEVSRTGAGFQAMLESGLRGVVFCEVFGMDDNRLNEIMLEMKDRVEKWKHGAEKSMLQVGVSPHSPYTVGPKIFYHIADWARREGLYLTLHLAESQDEYQFVKYGASMLANDFRDAVGWSHLLWQPTGASPVKYLEQWDVFEGEVLAAHCVEVEPMDVDLLKKYDVAVAHCPRSNAKLGTGIAPLPVFLRNGLKVGLGTDSLASSNTMDFFDEMRIGLLLQRGKEKIVDGLCAEDFVVMATLGGAQALRMEDKIGTLEAGKQADIIAVDISHSHQMPVRDPYSSLVYNANQEDVVFTMVGGRILYTKGQFSTLDHEKIMAEAEPIRTKLRK